jgi:hypothetical protein
MFFSPILFFIFANIMIFTFSGALQNVIVSATASDLLQIGLFILLFLLFFSLSYGLIILLPIYITLKVKFDAPFYLGYLSKYYDISIKPLETDSKIKNFFKAVFYVLLSLVLGLVVIIFASSVDFSWLMLLAFIPLYILIYKNFISALHVGIGDDFLEDYEKYKYIYIRKSIWIIMLMHIPFLFVLQPWFLLMLGNIYFTNKSTFIHILSQESVYESMNS